jgi:DNA polymerase III subunit delta
LQQGVEVSETVPSIYIFHGEDEFGITVELDKIKTRLGEDGPVDMDFIVLELGSFSFEEFQAMAMTVPFFARRRTIVLNNILKQFNSSEIQAKFKKTLDQISSETAVVITESNKLISSHWLMKWAGHHSTRVYVREFNAPTGNDMTAWIRQQAADRDGEITPEAAAALAQLTGVQKRHAAQEIDKLLAHVAYERPVVIDDVKLLSTGVDEQVISMVFDMVDTLGQRKPQEAIDLLHQLLRVYDAPYLYFMIVRQFRLLILAREALDTGYAGPDLAKQMKIHPFVASKVLAQAHNFRLETLEAIYRQLLQLDSEIKTGQIDVPLALDTLVAGFIPVPRAR